jgi:hypothetical protein
VSDTKNTPLLENEYVKDLLDILRENKIDAHDLVGILGNAAAMEREMGKAVAELTTMRRELAEMREEAGHPVRTALQNAAKGIAAKIRSVSAGITALKNKLIAGCKSAGEAFKSGGISALNNLAGFFEIRRELEFTRDAINDAIRSAESKIAKIDAVSEELHTAGRAVRNIGLALQGKETVPDIKPNGKLAQLAAAPFRVELRRLNRSLNRANKSLAGLDRLEKAAERQAAKNRPSTLENIKQTQAVVSQRKKDAPAEGKGNRTEAAI